MKLVREHINPDTVADDVRTIREAAFDLMLVSDDAEQVVWRREDYVRIIKAAGNLAAGETYDVAKSDVQRLIAEEEVLRGLVEGLEGLHFISDTNGIRDLLTKARALSPEKKDRPCLFDRPD